MSPVLDRLEREIWRKIRCWHRLTAEEAGMLRYIDARRRYVRMPDWIEVTRRAERMADAEMKWRWHEEGSLSAEGGE